MRKIPQWANYVPASWTEEDESTPEEVAEAEPEAVEGLSDDEMVEKGICPSCGADFTDKRNPARSVKTHMAQKHGG